MKKYVAAFMVIFLLAASVAQSAEIMFNPSVLWYDVTSEGVLELWGVPEANGQALQANPDYDWPSVNTVSLWTGMLLKAQEMGLSVPVGYDPGNLDIWYIGKPR